MLQLAAKIGRNDPCPCDSGLKYKKCCYEKKSDSDMARVQNLQTTLKNNLTKSMGEMVFLEPNSQALKMSEVILEFADDMLQESETSSEKRTSIRLACLAWNLALIKDSDEKRYEKELEFFLGQMGIKNPEDLYEIKPLITDLVNKKLSHYSEINRLIIHYEIDCTEKDVILNIASIIPPEEIKNFKKVIG